MKKQVFFGLMLAAWIAGIFLICIFPPVSDFQIADEHTGHLSSDTVPEFHLRNSFPSGSIQVDLSLKFLDSAFGFRYNPEVRLLGSISAEQAPSQLSSHFDTIILFQAFFETW
jgi:hypothetical protein